jgi:formylglycine-generating enzyme required for sulfatase activity
MPKPAGGIYCIDRSEVTNAQYQAFLDAPKTGLVVPAACGGNASYAPATSSACTNTHFDPTNLSTHPVTCVDWCDAAAYCRWAGKRLCGGVSGGAVSVTDFANPARSQWYNACSRGGTRKFPYGNTYASGYCNGLDYMAPWAIAVVSAANCQGGYDGLYDMSGNVREWEDGCDASGNCLQRGGSYLDHDASSITLRCHSGGDSAPRSSAPTAPRFDTSSQRGFRCCLDG